MSVLVPGDAPPGPSPGSTRARRARRVAAGGLVAALVLGAFAFVLFGGWYLLHHDNSGTTKAAGCSPLSPAAVPAALPVLVLNGTSRNGLARSVSRELAKRGFAIADIGNAAHPLHGTPVVRRPTDQVATAQKLARQVPGAHVVADKALRSEVVLVLGDRFTRLRTPAEVRRLPAPRPSPTCTG